MGQQPAGTVPAEVVDELLPRLLDIWTHATEFGQTDAAVEAATQLDRLLRQDVA